MQLKSQKKMLEAKIREITRQVKAIAKEKKANVSALKKLDEPKTQQADVAGINTLRSIIATQDAESSVQAEHQQTIKSLLEAILDQFKIGE